MEYIQFEQELKSQLLNNNARKLIYKLVEAPYRFYSILSPLSFRTKLEQAFYRSQENKYYKFLTSCASNLFAKYGYKIMENKISITKPIEDNPETYIVQTASFTHLFQNEEDKIIYAILQKKRDVYSAKESIKLLDKFKSNLLILAQGYQDYTIKGYLWFVESEFRKNESYYHSNSVVQEEDSIKYSARYASEIFRDFDHREDWDEIELHIEKFKRQNYLDFIELPDLDTSQEALEALVELSDSAWEKLNSPTPAYINVRKSVFNEANENSNLFKAIALREIKLKAIDEDEFKLESMRLENRNKQ
ncbi:HpyAIV family type II restriction enzyme [Mycoplasmopsis primatum]|uniref:HpyAIV family type II restriction enzyme n=1 Tax=Mycoplasmopsis primatum TaxID=55604 RepID=UPI000496A13A|nr:hypothetical protein [Mycoplasmopsis primatum]